METAVVFLYSPCVGKHLSTAVQCGGFHHRGQFCRQSGTGRRHLQFAGHQYADQLFYGIIPVCFTYYVQALSFSLLSFLLSLALGLLSTNILIVNNYRDYEQDKAARKRTTIVLFGRTFGVVAYLLNGLLAILLALPLLVMAPSWLVGLFAAFGALFFVTWQEMRRCRGRALNRTLGRTARNVFLFAVLLSIALLFV